MRGNDTSYGKKVLPFQKVKSSPWQGDKASARCDTFSPHSHNPFPCFYEDASPPTHPSHTLTSSHPLPTHQPAFPYTGKKEPSQDQELLFLLMPDNAILYYIGSWSHGSLHVYSLVGGLVPENSGGGLIHLQDDYLVMLKAIRILVQERQTQDAVAKANQTKESLPVALDKHILGIDTGDAVLNEAARILRMLHMEKLRELQMKINEAIAIQAIIADPKTDHRWGKIVRFSALWKNLSSLNPTFNKLPCILLSKREASRILPNCSDVLEEEQMHGEPQRELKVLLTFSANEAELQGQAENVHWCLSQPTSQGILEKYEYGDIEEKGKIMGYRQQ
ncbi:uncharacterized protein LOC116911939 [Rattus rattus]|uniref:uncharacterized protein LOC116911939 n=1 Tax=Rattus rattus TaxID=10117 RepID=UPI0013F34768|nr:uncharacterized protein LOC116911939 [Rattus rattus]